MKMVWLLAIIALPVMAVLVLAWADWVQDKRREFYGGMI
jgi:hypothetical protein